MKTTRWMAAALLGALALVATVDAQEKKPTAVSSPKAATQRSFAAPEDAVKALVDAVRAGDVNAMLAVIGPQSRSWLATGDKVADATEWKNFLAAYDKKNEILREGDAKAVLSIGGDGWKFPAPLVAKAGKWSFDAEAGRTEVLNRRVGRNELDTIQTLLAIVDAQREYAAADPDGSSLQHYAMKFMSSPGKKDGLYWPTQPGEPASPLGPLVGKAVREGYFKGKPGKPQPYHGYYFRILTGQGRDAPGGAYDYMVKGKLFGGFAVVAWPASYRNSGVKTFIVSHDGVVWEKDLGPATASKAAEIKRFNPDKTWSKSPQ